MLCGLLRKYALRQIALKPSAFMVKLLPTLGLLALGSAGGGFLGIALGGIIADYFRAKTLNARL